ncbi:branched-chain amino acid ABC transporter substrate-binding protein [Limoniibacter endophyticus]|uniref:Branched chain amino acid ABC transporter substrate-binding protein n=1 Tax=Limoniibacter endophyticus TaxID=1565040 RepID=A0A8J3DPQ6_9HYPH|nr:branched-chain amino acid ABC transporter substrate-binding protein [Limoniibacter endophyticus]GHC69708.1 branched chain amino acid ABC transporter substrate-binding protein [Limoniibacter endophyticus]
MRITKLAGLSLAVSMLMSSAAYADIVIGVVAPLTGPVAAYGEQVKNGVETAVEVINEKGGVNGEKLVVKLADDKGDPRDGVSAANNLIADGVKYVVGPVTSGVAMAVSDVLAENGALMVTPTATAPDLTNRGLENVLRTCGRDDQQAEVAAAYVLEHMKDKKVAILDDKGTYGAGLANAFKAALNEGGMTEVSHNTLNPGEKDYSALVTRLKADGAEVIYFGGYHPEGGLLARQLKEGGVNATIIGGEGLSNTEFWAIGNEAAQNSLFTNAADASKIPSSAEAIKALETKNIPAEAFTLNAYAAVEVIKAGIEKAGSADDATAVAAALKDGSKVPTAIGELSYGETGDLSSPAFSVFKWEDGKIVAAQ